MGGCASLTRQTAQNVIDEGGELSESG
jgi:hypothetical protein